MKMNHRREKKGLLSCLPCVKGRGESPEVETKQPRRRFKKPTVEFHLLLLGSDGSGKSTFIKQMKVIHDGGFNDTERADYIPDIYRNIVDAMTAITEQMREENLNIPLSDECKIPDLSTFADALLPWDQRLSAVSRLWADPSVRRCFDRRSEYSLTHPINVSAKYFMENIERINEPGYLPINDDVIKVRRNTIGVISHEFTVTDILFKITGVGGEREERVRWIDFLAKKITSVIFLTAIDEFDTEFHTENGQTKNKLKESMETFRQIQTFQWLSHTTFILFLNKIDVFKEKITHSDIRDHFAEFKGIREDWETGRDFIKQKFMEKNQQSRNQRMIYPHETCATDTNNMKFVFDVVKDTILQLNLRQYNLV